MITPSFVPPDQAQHFWHQVIKPMITREELVNVRDYIEKTWIGQSWLTVLDGIEHRIDIFRNSSKSTSR
jgi:hypothetical protein